MLCAVGAVDVARLLEHLLRALRTQHSQEIKLSPWVLRVRGLCLPHRLAHLKWRVSLGTILRKSQRRTYISIMWLGRDRVKLGFANLNIHIIIQTLRSKVWIRCLTVVESTFRPFLWSLLWLKSQLFWLEKPLLELVIMHGSWIHQGLSWSQPVPLEIMRLLKLEVRLGCLRYWNGLGHLLFQVFKPLPHMAREVTPLV